MSTEVELKPEATSIKDELLGQSVTFHCTAARGIATITGTVQGYVKGFNRTMLIKLYTRDRGFYLIDPKDVVYYHVQAPDTRLTIIDLPEDDSSVQFRVFNVHEVEIGYIDYEDYLHLYDEEKQDDDSTTNTADSSEETSADPSSV